MNCRLEIKVIPGASRSEVSGWLGQCLKVKVAAAPEKGKANQAVIKLLSEILKIQESAMAIVSGLTSQRKVVEISGLSQQQLESVLPSKPD